MFLLMTVKLTNSNKNTSLIHQGIYHGCKRFYDTGPGLFKISKINFSDEEQYFICDSRSLTKTENDHLNDKTIIIINQLGCS
jgi:hypothetical protein